MGRIYSSGKRHNVVYAQDCKVKASTGGLRSSEQTNLIVSENLYNTLAEVMNRDNLSVSLGWDKIETEHSWIHLFPNNSKCSCVFHSHYIEELIDSQMLRICVQII